MSLLFLALPVLTRAADVAPVTNAEYQTECGSCHFAYQPGLLPAGSWQKIMTGLDNHFGENAELNADVGKRLLAYLVSDAADTSSYRRSRKIMQSLGREQPLRITQVPYFKSEHREIPARLIKGNDRVKSLSNCGVCHGSAAKGSFSEDEVEIPGHGRWDD
jgi:hypothetical protein